MIYKRLFLGLIFFSLLISERYVVDIDKSSIFWIGRKMTGEHFGKIKVKEGYIDIDENRINGGNIIIDMESITVLDIEEEKWNKKLEIEKKLFPVCLEIFYKVNLHYQ